MQLNHLDLGVEDAVVAATFLEQHFDFRIVEIMVNDARAILDGPGGVSLVLTRQPAPIEYPKNFHVGFLVDDEQAVLAKHAELTAAAVGSISPIRELRGTTQFYFTMPGGLLVEVGWRPEPA